MTRRRSPPVPRTHDELLRQALAVCRDVISDGLYPDIRRVARALRVGEVMATKLRAELEASKQIDLISTRARRGNGLYGETEPEIKEIEARMDRARKKKELDIRAMRESDQENLARPVRVYRYLRRTDRSRRLSESP